MANQWCQSEMGASLWRLWQGNRVAVVFVVPRLDRVTSTGDWAFAVYEEGGVIFGGINPAWSSKDAMEAAEVGLRLPVVPGNEDVMAIIAGRR